MVSKIHFAPWQNGFFIAMILYFSNLNDPMAARSRKGFTLLEILVVIIIVGVLASVALPALFRNVERSRTTEALHTMGIIKRGVEACATQFGGSSAVCSTYNDLGMLDPSASVGANASSHFTYAFGSLGANGAVTVTATRVSLDGGNAGDTIVLTRTTTGDITKQGTTAFQGIQ